jgi:hypothetical protein
MGAPDWPIVKCGKFLAARVSVYESSEPNEAVRTIEVSELSNYRDSQCFLGLDKRLIE